MVAEENNSLDSNDQEATPLTVGQLGMWVFISTEVMLFAAIIATYFVFRISALGVGWPSAAVMHVSMLTGIVNTVILVISGVTAWSGYNAAKEDRPMAARLWLMATLFLGVTFIGIKSYEYYGKYKVGLMPVPGQKQIHEIADHDYLSHVKARLKDDIANLESLEDQQRQLSKQEQERRDLLYSLKQFMAEVTEKNAGRTQSPYMARLRINLMAWQIFPHPDTGLQLEEVLEPEVARLQRDLEADTERLELVRRRQELVMNQITQLGDELKQFRLLNPTGDDAVNMEDKQKWLETKQKQEQELLVESKRLETTINPMLGRMDNLMDSFGGEDEILGVNERYDVRLPVVVPNGQAWMSMYLLLTGTHALHLIAGLIVLLWWIPRKMDAKRAPALYVTCMYWQFVDAIWLAIFWFVYF